MNSPRESPQQQRNMNESKNISSILPPEITSTPFISNKTKSTSPLVTPTKKFLGPRRYALSNNGMLKPMNAIKDPPGPLLASTSYNVNVGTYIDTKSPGYAGRLVQYNEESSRKQQHTHQERYGSPGLLPIVHLFKKDVPVISPKPRKATVRIGTPESRGYYSQEHSRLLLEGIVRNNSILKEQNNSNEAGTRSVLDALKEISRKRIHANEDYDPMDDNHKKIRRANGAGDYSKRNRVESPPSENASSPPMTQAKKRLCTIDAVLASKTSSMYANYESSSKRKSCNEDSPISPRNKKKYSTVETQTPRTPVIVRELKRLPVKTEKEEKPENPIEVNDEIEEITVTPKPILKVLDDKPLEVIRKNRLGALLSALSGREIPSIPMEDRRKALDKNWPSQSSEKTIVSILSPQHKQTKSVEKHVSFNLPESTESISSSIPSNPSENSSTATNKNDKVIDISTEQSNKFSSSVTFSSINTGEKENKSEPSNTLNKVDTQNDIEGKKKIVGGFKFDLNKPIDSKACDTMIPVAQEKVTDLHKTPEKNTEGSPFSTTSTVTQMFGFKTSTSGPEEITSESTSTINSLGLPQSLPLNKHTKTPEIVVTSSSFTFGATGNEDMSASKNKGDKETVPFSLQEKTNVGKITSSIPSNSVGNSISPFGLRNASNSLPSFSNVSSAPSLGSTTSVVTSTLNSSVSTGNFSSKTFEAIASPPSSKATFGISNSSPGGFKFESATSLPSFVSSSNNFKPPATTASSNGSGASENNVSSSTSTLFETPTKTNNLFGSAPASMASSIFGSNSVSTIPTGQEPKPFVFGLGNDKNPNNSSPTTLKPSFTFNKSQNVSTSTNSISSTSNLQFTSVANNTNNMLPPEKNPAPFGVSTTSSFGTSGSFNFGSPNVSKVTTTSPNSSIFNTTNANSFGTSNNPAFGNTSTSGFSSTTIPSFGSVTTSNFGAPNTSSFATSTTANGPNFGAKNALTFGSTNNSGFGTSTSTFGATSSSNFQTTKAPSFGTTNAPPNFGAGSIPNFGANSTGAFGTINTPSFSSSNTSFNSTSTPSFGTISSVGTTNPSNSSTAKTPVFGSNNPLFGGTNSAAITGTNSTFGVTSTAATSFGANTSTFGTPTSSMFANNKNTPSFGNVTTASNFASSFPSPSTLNAPSFGNPSSPFGNTTTGNSNAFNSNNQASSFSKSSGTNSFGNFSTNNVQFPANTTASTFGTSSSNTFGNTPAFPTNSSHNTFGSSNPVSPFGANSTASNSFSSSFGKKPEQPATAFSNSTNMFNNNNGNTLFGSSQSNNNAGTGGSSSSGIFSFGSSNNVPSAPGVFTFGATEPPKAFNFSSSGSSGNVPAPVVNTFNSAPSFAQPNSAPSFAQPNSAPSFAQPNSAVPNMFSIGSGSTPSTSQARSRPVVRARRRT